MDINYSEKELEKFTPKKQIPPPPNIPAIKPSYSHSSGFTGLWSKFSFLKFKVKPKILIIIASATVILITFILIALGFSVKGKGDYKKLESFLLNNEPPAEVHSNIEIYFKIKRASALFNAPEQNSWFSNLLAFITPPGPAPSSPIGQTGNSDINYWTEEKMQNAKPREMEIPSAPVSIEPSINLMTPNFENIEIKLNINSDTKTSSDKTAIEKLKSQINGQIKLGPISSSLMADILFLNDIFYFKLNSGSLLDVYINDIQDKWIKVDLKNILKQFAKVDYEKIFQNEAYSKNLEQKILALFQDTKIKDIFIIHKSKNEKINGINAYYYEISFKKEFISNALTGLFKILSDFIFNDLFQTLSYPYEDKKGIVDFDFNFDASINEFGNEAEIKQFADFISQIPFEIWFGEKDSLLYKFKIDLGKTVAKIKSQLPIITAVDDSNQLKSESPSFEGYFLIQYSDYGKDFQIEAPTEYKNIEEFLSQFGITAPSDYSTKATRNTKRIADIITLQLALELYYNDFGKYPISQKFTKLDKDSVLYKTLSAKQYITDLPQDPMFPEFYYAYKSNGKQYELSARLEYYPEIKDKCDPSTNQICLYIVKSD